MSEPIFDCKYCGGPCGLGDACPQNGDGDPCMGCNQPAGECRCGDCDHCHAPTCDEGDYDFTNQDCGDCGEINGHASWCERLKGDEEMPR